jgi:hypothetical protein
MMRGNLLSDSSNLDGLSNGADKWDQFFSLP